MQYLKIADPAATKFSFGHGEDLSNYAILASPQLFLTIRDSFVIDVHLRRQIQNRPFYHYNGSAEHLFLYPLLKSVFGRPTPSVISQQIDVARGMGALSVGIASLRSDAGVKSLAAYLSSYKPVEPTVTYQQQLVGEKDGKLEADNPNALFSIQLHKLFSDPKTRESLMDAAARGTLPRLNTDTFTSFTVLQDLITDLNIYGVAGKQHPLLGKSATSVLNAQFAVEQYLFDADGSVQTGENRFAAAIMYLIYMDIVSTPESYDAILPTVHLNPNNTIVANQTLKLIGQLAKTNLATAYAPTAYAVIIYCKMLRELVEYLNTVPNPYPEMVAQINKRITDMETVVNDYCYSPVKTLANEVFDYVKQLTGARYILPDWIRDWNSNFETEPAKPFKNMPYPALGIVPATFRGSVEGLRSVHPMSGNDIAFLLQQIKQKTDDMYGVVFAVKNSFETLNSSLMMPSGDVIVHLNALGKVFQDPPLSKLEPPTPTRVYVTPSYFPMFNRDQAGSMQWVFSDKIFRPLFLNAYRRNSLQRNFNADHFAWDTEVRMTASPSTGTDFAALFVPSHYVADCATSVISNDIAVVKQILASSPHRVMASITDYFTPLFQTLSGGSSMAEVIADAVASMFFIYEAKNSAISSDTSNPANWSLISPSLPYIYGYPTANLVAENSPFKNSPSGVATMKHIELSRDGKYMMVLHRRLPKAAKLRYYPFIMKGGTTISLPIQATLATQAKDRAEAVVAGLPTAAEATPAKFASLFYAELEKLNVGVTNGLFEVSHWLPSFAFFPHIFVTNRHASTHRSLTALADIFRSEQRFIMAHDHNTPNGTQISYYRPVPVMFDIEDEVNAFSEAYKVIDFKEDIAKQSSGKAVSSQGTDKPSTAPQLNDDATLNPEPTIGDPSRAFTDPATGMVDIDPIKTKKPGDEIPGLKSLPHMDPDNPSDVIGDK